MNKKIQKKLSKYKIGELDWFDSSDSKEIKLNDIIKHPTTKYLGERKSVGWLIKEDAFGVIIITDIDEELDCEITAIPKKSIINIKRVNEN